MDRIISASLGFLNIFEKILNLPSFFKVENKTIKEIKKIDNELKDADLDENVKTYNVNKRKQLINGLSFYNCVSINVDVISESAKILDYSKEYTNNNNRLNLLLKNYHIIDGKLTRKKSISSSIEIFFTNLFVILLVIHLFALMGWALFGVPYDWRTALQILIQTIGVVVILYGAQKISVSYFELRKFDSLVKKYYENREL
ncbi:hypothetical protein [Providencia rettgeri]|uniref:hypothetical protein n=1 Tax=Providencia rettgeri TaxID=587 RepID=UPI0032DB9DE2